jgi:hypothetical protein
MVDDKTKKDRRDRAQVAAGEEYEIRRYLLQKAGTRKREALELIRRFGNDRGELLREARKLATTGWATALKQ